MPIGTESSTTAAPTQSVLHRPCHIRWSAHSSPNHFSVVPVHGVTVGKRDSVEGGHRHDDQRQEQIDEEQPEIGVEQPGGRVARPFMGRRSFRDVGQADLEDPHHRLDEDQAQQQQEEGVGRALRPVLALEEPVIDDLGEPGLLGEPRIKGTA